MTTHTHSRLLLNWAALKNTHFHWFWRLTYKEKQTQGSLADSVIALLTDEQCYVTMKAKQEQIQRYPSMIRFIFWLFNINNYTQEAYTLAAYESYRAYQTFCQSSLRMENTMTPSYAIKKDTTATP